MLFSAGAIILLKFLISIIKFSILIKINIENDIYSINFHAILL